jgi:glutamate-1-semialdehyde aminotransferase
MVLACLGRKTTVIDCDVQWREMLRGVLFHPSQCENLFPSLVHSGDDVSHTLDAAEQAFAMIGEPGS